jgi:hypothetical protein
MEGFHPDYGGLVLAEFYRGELDPTSYTVEYPHLQFGLSPCESYLVGDFNGSGEFNVADIVQSFSYLSTGSPEGAFICECPPGSGHDWAVAMDVNNTCAFNVADIVVAYQRLSYGQPEFQPCQYCPPAGR